MSFADEARANMAAHIARNDLAPSLWIATWELLHRRLVLALEVEARTPIA